MHYLWPHIPFASLPPTNAALGRYKGTPLSNFLPHYPLSPLPSSSFMTPFMFLPPVWASGLWTPPGFLVKVQPRWHERPLPRLRACKAPAPQQIHSSLSSLESSSLPRPRPLHLEKEFGKSQWGCCPLLLIHSHSFYCHRHHHHYHQLPEFSVIEILGFVNPTLWFLVFLCQYLHVLCYSFSILVSHSSHFFSSPYGLSG